MLRNADTYRDNAIGLADRMGGLVAAPLFELKQFPNEAYQLGGLLRKGKWQPPEDWTWNLVPPLIEEIRKREGRPDMPYYLIGHSAGGQFLSRLSGFVPTKAERIVAANPGSHLFPSMDFPFPHGFGKLPDELGNEVSIQKYLKCPLTIYVGTADKEKANLPMDANSMKQGANRYERGINCFKTGQKLAQEKGWEFQWRLVEAPDIGHDAKAMFNHEKSQEAMKAK
jgi:hypothetical protein